MVVKRRTLWLYDETWEELAEIAAEVKGTPSQAIGAMVLQWRTARALSTAATNEPSFNSRPFTPVPK